MSRLVRVALISAMVTSGLFALTPQSGEAILRLIAKPVTQSISLAIKRGNDYERLEQQRDQEIADARARSRIAEEHRRQGWIDEAALETERDRYDALTDAITARTEREKRITRDTYGRAVGVVWREAAVSAIVQVSDLDPTAAQALRGLSRGEHPLRAAADALLQRLTTGNVDSSPDDIAALEDQWQSTRNALRAIRLPGTESLDARLRSLLLRSTRLQEGRGSMTETVFEDEIAQLRAAAAETQALIDQTRGLVEEWTVSFARISPERFERDERWQRLAGEVASLDGPTAGRALVAGMLRSAEARVLAVLDDSGLVLDDESFDRLVTRIAHEAVLARVRASSEGGSVLDVTLEEVARQVVNETRAAAGQEPLPEASTGTAAMQDVPLCPPQVGTRPHTGEGGEPELRVRGGSREWECRYSLGLAARENLTGEGLRQANDNARLWVTWTEAADPPTDSAICGPPHYSESISEVTIQSYLLLGHPERQVLAEIFWTTGVGINRAEAEQILAPLLATFATRSIPCP